MGVEITVGAFFCAPRDVNIYTEGWDCRFFNHVGIVGAVFLRNKPLKPRASDVFGIFF